MSMALDNSVELKRGNASSSGSQDADLASQDKGVLSSTEELIEEARSGRMFILVDDEDRENEGDLVIPAELITPDAINFMAREGRGLICLALEGQRIEQLGLHLMPKSNESRHGTAFTVSIEAREGVTTGISAADRAHTIQTATDPTKDARDITTPGHIFPLYARDGGTLVRAGHTEAAVDISRLAGLNPSGVICEIMNDDGTMARLPDLIPMAQRHGLKIGTIADLITHRRRTETLVERTLQSKFTSQWGGEFSLHLYVNKINYAEHVALVKGNVLEGDDPVLVRMHASNVLDDVLADTTGGYGTLQAAMEQVGEAGRGIVVLLREPRATSLSDQLRECGAEEIVSPKDHASPPAILRDYGIGAQILRDLGVRTMALITDSPKSIIGLEGFGLTVSKTVGCKNR